MTTVSPTVLKKLFLFREAALPGNQLLDKLHGPVKLGLGLGSLMPKTSQTRLEVNEIPDGSMGYGGTIESVMDHLVTSFDLLLEYLFYFHREV